MFAETTKWPYQFTNVVLYNIILLAWEPSYVVNYQMTLSVYQRSLIQYYITSLGTQLCRKLSKSTHSTHSTFQLVVLQEFYIQNLRRIDRTYIYIIIYIYTVLVCLYVCIVSNKRQNYRTDRAQTLWGTSLEGGMFMEDWIFNNLPSLKFFFLKIHNFFFTLSTKRNVHN